MPMAAGICRAEPFTKTVRWAWMWNTVCSLVWQLIPSVGWPVTAVAVLASAAADGTGTCSGPSGPAAGAGPRAPSELSGARSGWPVALAPPPPETASVIPTTSAMTTTAAPEQISHRRRRLRLASSARICAIRSRARCSLALLLFDTMMQRTGLAACSGGDGHRGADDAGVVEQRRGHDAGPDPGQPGHPLLRLLADPAAHDDQVR